MFRFEEEEPPSDTEFSQYHGSAETERATCAPTRFPGRVFAFFRRAAKEGRSRRSETAFVQTSVPAVANYPPNILRIRRLSLLFAAMSRRLRRADFFAAKEIGERNRQREPRRRTGEWPVSGFWPNTGKIPPAPPLQIETVRFDLRRTFRRNLQAATKGSCAVFRRIRTRNPSPSARGLRPP